MDEIPTPPAATGLRKLPRRALTVSIATAALVVVGGAVVAGAVAAAPDGNGTPAPAAPGQTVPGQPGGGPRTQNDQGPRMVGPGRAVHGEYTVPNGNGGYSTEEMQRGSITAVNGSTFTVKSEDGYTHDWVTDANTGYGMRRGGTNGGLTTGENVMVMGTKDGDTFHAVRVMTMRQPGQNQKGPFGDQGPRKMPYQAG
jgi:hypothetical protein